MVNNENETSEASDALLRSESLRAAQEETDAANNNSQDDNNGTFTVRINVGNHHNNEGGTSELRQRRRIAQEDEQTSRNTINDDAPVHARTINRMPGQVHVVPSQPLSHGGPVRRIHIQTNPSARGPTVGTTSNNGGATSQEQHQHVQFVTMNGRQRQRGNADAAQHQRITIPLRTTSSRARAIRVAPGGRNHQVQIVGNAQGRPPQQVRVQLPPLEPQPLPYHGLHRSTDSNSSSEPNHNERNEFKCLICFEFLQDPASCGKCSSRFCLACLRRVAQTRTSNGPAKGKCPACRGDLDDIVLDKELANRMQRANTVTCQYEGCNVQLPLTQVAAHEQSCVFVPIKCRYAAFGCDWKGTRQTLSSHEATCPLMQVSELVQQFRQTRADHEYTLNQLQSRVAASNAMMELHASLIRRLQKRNYHPGDILDFVYTITCTPARFIYTKDVWRSLTACRLSRGFLLNVLTFLPTTLVVLRIAATGFRQFLSAPSLHKDFDSLVNASYSFLISFMFCLMVTIFVVSGKNSVEWQPTNRMERFLPRVGPWFLQGSCAFLSCVVQSESMFYSYNNRGIITWPMICICSALFPSLILTMMDRVSGRLTREYPVDNFQSAGRAIPIVLFGLRYGLVANATGVIACLDAVVFQSFLRRIKSERMKPLFVSQDCFLTDLPRHVGDGYIALRCVALMFSSLLLWNTGISTNGLDSFVACILLLAVNHLTNHLILLGKRIAKHIHAQALENVLPNQGGVRKECNLVGCLSFATWLLLLSSIVLSY